ncbi:transposase [Streptomyces sp. PVA_94-07]|nr:transposase [Streptomyces sp. PVA_94-07]
MFDEGGPQQLHQHRSGDGPQHPDRAAAERGAADDDRGDGGELHQGAERGRVAGGEPGGGEDAGQRREGAAEDVDAGQDAFDGESGEDGGLAVAADGDDLAAGGGAGDQEGRKQKGSKNRDKARLKVARAHAKVADARREFHHQLSTRLISENQGIAVEDLSVAGLARTRLAKSIRDAGWASFISTLEYKAQRYGRTLVKIGRFEPTSQTCSTCGVKDGPKPLHVREWTCRACATVHDRDHNAAINVKVAAGLAVSACGAPVRPGAIPAQREETGSHGFPTGKLAA